MKKYSRYSLIVLVCIAGFLNSCSKSKPSEAIVPTLSVEDSLVAANIENYITFGRTDSGLIKISQLEKTDNYHNHLLFQLKLKHNFV